MKELLEELQKIDPKTFDLINYSSNTLHGSGAMQNPNARIIGHIIQGEIQRAIEAKGWIWTVTKEDSQSPYAIDGTSYGVIIFNDQIDVLVEDVYADSPAEAILACYLAAIRSQP